MTLSILKEKFAGSGTITIALLAGLAGAGCSSNGSMQLPKAKERTIGKLQPTVEPVVIDDEAIEMRRWPQSVAYYRNGTTETFAPRWHYEGYETDSMIANAVIEPTMFVVEAASYPFRVIGQPPGTMEKWAGPVIPPTYTAVAPLPPQPAPAAKAPDPIGDTHRIVKSHVVSPVQRWIRSEQAKSGDSLAAKGAPFGGVRDFFRGVFGIHSQRHVSVQRPEEPVAPSTEPATTTSPTTEPSSPVTEPSTTAPATTTAPAEGSEPATKTAVPFAQ